jgi:hypothetical protein
MPTDRIVRREQVGRLFALPSVAFAMVSSEALPPVYPMVALEPILSARHLPIRLQKGIPKRFILGSHQPPLRHQITTRPVWHVLSWDKVACTARLA